MIHDHFRDIHLWMSVVWPLPNRCCYL